MKTNARTRLALTYLAIIMVLTLGFSTAFYYQSINEANNNLLRQQNQLSEYLFFTTPEGISNIQAAELAAFKSNLFKRLALLNIGMLVLGTVVSSILARRSLRPLEEAFASQSRFTSDAAHELRTPLTAMKTEIEVALRDKKLKLAESNKVLESNLEEIAKLQSLTDALLRLAHSGEKIDKSNWQTYSLNDILGSARERLSTKAAKKKIKINLPNNSMTIYGDPDQLVELFVTLLGNAIKYSPERSEVDVKAKRHEGKVCVDVIDRGVGITEVDLPHIFERFYRADTARSNGSAEGYGLGLSLAEAIVQAHGGKISVKSKYGKGSTFTVSLPKN